MSTIDRAGEVRESLQAQPDIVSAHPSERPSAQPSAPRQVLALALRELRSLLAGPGLYLVAAFQTLLGAAWFYFGREFFASGVADPGRYFEQLPLVLALGTSVLLARSWAEEHRSGGFDLLASLPASSTALVLGKYLGGLVCALLGLLPLAGVPVAALGLVGFDPGLVVSGFLGLACFLVAAVAIAQFASSLTRSQSASIVLSAGMLAFFLVAERSAAYLSPQGIFVRVLREVSASRHLAGFFRGVIDSYDLLYFGLLAVLVLAMTVYSVERRR